MKFEYRRFNLNLTLLLIVAFFGLTTQNIYATELNVAQRYNALFNKAQSQGKVPVIVTFKNLSNQKSTGPEIAVQQINSRQINVLNNLPDKAKRSAKLFKNFPQMALSVDTQTLNQLLSDSSLTVYEDKLHKPSLAEALPVVFSNYASSPYNGGGEWTIAVLDSGVDYSHPFFNYLGQSRLVAEACFSNGTGDVSFTSSLCPDEALSTTEPGAGQACSASIDGCDHGTHVAGIALGYNGSLQGVAREANLISIQVFSQINDADFCQNAAPCLGAFTSDLIGALDYVYSLRNTHKIAAVNMSLGSGRYTGSCDSEPHAEPITRLRNAGIASIVASGNAGYASEVAVPGCVTDAITVGASTLTDSRATFSNNSSMLDYYAPGTSINSSVLNSAYANKSGTSMATPFVAGAWAAAKTAHPNASVDLIEQVFDKYGPTITSFGIARKRIELPQALAELHTLSDNYVPPEPCEFYNIPNPANGKTIVVCL